MPLCCLHRLRRSNCLFVFFFLILKYDKAHADIESDIINPEKAKHVDLVSMKNESAKAYEMFSIVMSDEAEESAYTGTHAKHLIFKEGVVLPHWKPSTMETDDPTQALFYHGSYADRINFDFVFSPFPNYAIRKPSCTSSQKNVAIPKVIDFQIDGEEMSGSFSIVYDCQKSENRERNTTILVEFPIVDDAMIHFAFRKTCGGGQHKYLEFGYYEESDNEGAEVSRVTFPAPTTPSMTVGPHVMRTKVYLLLLSPAKSQEFFHVSAKSSSEALTVSVQGPVFGGILQHERATMLYIFYECHQTGKHRVWFEIPIRPFETLKASWVKDCGGGVADGLSVGTDAFTLGDVVRKGETDAAWLMALKATSGRIGDLAPVVNTSTRFTDFWVSNEGIALHIAPEIITVEKPELLTVYSLRSVVRPSGIQRESGGLMATGSKMRLRLRLVCKKKGRSLVLVTFAIKSFSKVDFGFVKECRAPMQYRHSGFMRTAKSVMIAVSLFMVTVLVTCWRFHSDESRMIQRMRTVWNARDSKTLADEETVVLAGPLKELKMESKV